MKVLVAVKRVVDYNIKIRVKSDGSGVELNNVKMSINPFDEIAVEEAVKLKEKGVASEVVVCSIGSKSCQETLRFALALGVERAIHIDAEDSPEPLVVAKILKKICEEESPNLVILGKQAIDDDCNQVGQMLSALLDWPQGTFISELSIEGDKANITREVDGGLEKIQINLPAIITTDLRLNVPRFAALPNIMKAKTKPLAVVEAGSLGIDTDRRLEVLKTMEPPIRQGGTKVATVEDLIDQIKKVI
ncbi:electron transfer flavoprotein subunit beta/FixA family protein [Candidatus Odyssella acanthamoebae]|uniref:Electron transfer flavoprotein subunit beta n=1 Tax=Candidatus Odyssella acanthamoebae TaxID=91604 RepID=A0A077AV71_9PROT|nr:electron transfer flavoprotein subunit beta/FixA family protein [Candidatus Paracaedibacter acanthamoebae]AIK95538.1 electron transfer flavoprotein subunit beta [Candidatus Paracaedibacter acanthamoebae]